MRTFIQPRQVTKPCLFTFSFKRYNYEISICLPLDIQNKNNGIIDVFDKFFKYLVWLGLDKKQTKNVNFKNIFETLKKESKKPFFLKK